MPFTFETQHRIVRPLADSTPDISVVIPTYNRPRQLLECLHALGEGFPANAEVIVVSDGGDPDLFPDLASLQSSMNLSVIHAPHGGPASARNAGIEAARGSLIAFTDDDCLPQTGWLQAIDKAARSGVDDGCIGVGGKTVNGIPGNACAEAAQMILDLVEQDRENRDYPPFFFASNNIAFPATELREVGGFDPEFRTAEDRELCRRWLRAGHRLTKADDAIVAHASDLTLGQFWRKFSRYGEGAARFHDDPKEGWRNTLLWHSRLPHLTWQYVRRNRPSQPFRLVLLLGVWEVANLVGFVRGALK